MISYILKRGVVAALIWSCATLGMQAVPIQGINGTVIDFTGVFDAKPEGLVAVTTAESTAMTVPWDRIDLEHLKENQPDIHAAYERAKSTGRMQPLGMGIAENMLSLELLESAIKYTLTQRARWPYTGYALVVKKAGVGDARVLTYDDALEQNLLVRGATSATYTLMIELRDVTFDADKASAHNALIRSRKQVIDSIRQLDYILAQVPPATMVKRTPRQSQVIFATQSFMKAIDAAMTKKDFQPSLQSEIKTYFTLLKVI
jgi:hypothetical protein